MTLSQREASARSTLAAWAVPVISDRISEIYDGYFRQGLITQETELPQLQRRHARLWGCLLNGQHAEARAYRKDIRRLVQKMGLDIAHVDQVDRIVIDDLMDMIISRFGRSRETAHAYGLELVAAASSLAESRVLAV